jgi:hypothetical protein
LFGSVVLDENGFGTSPQREELRVLGALHAREPKATARAGRNLIVQPTEDFFCRTKAFWSITTDREKTGASGHSRR